MKKLLILFTAVFASISITNSTKTVSAAIEKNVKIFVAGHKGLVGSAILNCLQLDGYNNIITRTSKELDLRDQKAVNDFFESEKPEYVFLAAAKVGGILANSTYPAEFIYNNIMIAANVINAAQKYGVKKLINLGSSCIYPRLAPQPIQEEYLLTGSLEPTNEPYAIAKIAAIKLCSSYNRQFGTNFLSVMPTNLYGSCDNFNFETAHVLPALIRKFYLGACLQNGDFQSIKKNIMNFPIGFGLDEKIRSASNEELTLLLARLGIRSESITLWGTGTIRREFLHVDDLARALVFLMGHYDAADIGEFINLGTGEDLTINELAAIIKKVAHFNGSIIYDSTKPDGSPQKLLNIEKIKKLGWAPQISLEAGIKRVLVHLIDRS